MIRIAKVALWALMCFTVSMNANAFSLERYAEGVHYTTLQNLPHKPNTVVEYFSFGCPHCSHLEPFVEAWLKTKPANVHFERVPAGWNAKFKILAQTYYSMEALNILDKVPAVFEHIHKRGKAIKTEEDAIALMATFGADKDVVQKTWVNSEVISKVREANGMFAKYQVKGVPAIIVNGKYLTSVSLAGSEQELFEVVDFLLAK